MVSRLQAQGLQCPSYKLVYSNLVKQHTGYQIHLNYQGLMIFFFGPPKGHTDPPCYLTQNLQTTIPSIWNPSIRLFVNSQTLRVRSKNAFPLPEPMVDTSVVLVPLVAVMGYCMLSRKILQVAMFFMLWSVKRIKGGHRS